MDISSLVLLVAIGIGIWVYRQYQRYQRRIKRKDQVWSVPISAWPEKDGETPIRRYFTHVKAAIGTASSPHAEFATLYDGLVKAVHEFSDMKTLGMRRLKYVATESKAVEQMGPNGLETVTKTIEKACYSGYEWVTYAQMWKEQGCIAGGLRKMGIQPKQIFGTWAPTCDLSETLPDIKLVVYFGAGEWDYACATQSQNAIEKISKHAAVMSYAELLEVGRMHPAQDTVPEPHDLVGVMYTSGSTGNPKGVLLTHNSLLSSLSAAEIMLLSYKKSYDLYLAYLPTSHVLEFIIQFAVLGVGLKIGYGTPYSLTDEMVSGCRGDLTELRPTLMVGVPQVWDTVRREIMHKVKSRRLIAQRIFGRAVDLKWRLMQAHLPAAWLDWIIFWKVQTALGGRLRYVLSGGSSISLETQKLLSTVLCPVLQGYGSTESSGIITLQQPRNTCMQRAGSVIPCLDVKLASVPEAGYFANNDEGEIYIRGTSVTPGYLNPDGDIDKPIPVVDADGWFPTGDIGRWHKDGQLQIVDRIKSMRKLANGEYIALEKVESLYKSSLYVMNVCIDAQPDQRRPLALIDPDPKLVSQLGQKFNYSLNRSIYDLCRDPRIKAAILQSLLLTAQKNKLTRAETVFDCVIDPDGWTPENGYLTAAAKLNRRKIQQKLAARIREAYASTAEAS
ncbi:long-chain fatty acid-CoA ligase [Dipsacomyces acuminosporus]|nr:long-chain fatty acid-CoA ligase [Dipsacomyces acuminosporus]